MADYYTINPYNNGNPKRINPSEVDKFTLKSYGLDVQGIKDQLFGINVIDPVTGKSLPDRFYVDKLKAAVAYVEKAFDIAVLPRTVVEEKDYHSNTYNSYMYLKLRKRPVLQVEQFSLTINNSPAISYDPNWWKVSSLGATIQVMPTIGMQMQEQYLPQLQNGYPLIGAPFMGSSVSSSMIGSTYAPQLFHVGYIAGMLPQARDGVEEEWEFPEDLKSLILKIGAKEVLNQFGRILIGAGIASKSITMDDISEAITSTSSAMYAGTTADIMQLDRDIDYLTEGLNNKFGIRLSMI